jgi:hypothetical protein
LVVLALDQSEFARLGRCFGLVIVSAQKISERVPSAASEEKCPPVVPPPSAILVSLATWESCDWSVPSLVTSCNDDQMMVGLDGNLDVVADDAG